MSLSEGGFFELVDSVTLVLINGIVFLAVYKIAKLWRRK